VIREARLRSGLSQRAVARRAGTSQAAISRIERGIEQPTFERLEQILAGLGWRPELELKPLAEHDAEPRRLYLEATRSASERLEDGLSWTKFLGDLRVATRAS
jgi:transcriptional regulator with XRE-family HTH domain